MSVPSSPGPAPLVVESCRTACAWGPTAEHRRGLRVFACAGCGSEWVRSEPWTPVDADGVVPTPVAAEAARRSPRRDP